MMPILFACTSATTKPVFARRTSNGVRRGKTIIRLTAADSGSSSTAAATQHGGSDAARRQRHSGTGEWGPGVGWAGGRGGEGGGGGGGLCRSAAVPLCRCAAVPLCRCAAVPLCRCRRLGLPWERAAGPGCCRGRRGRPGWRCRARVGGARPGRLGLPWERAAGPWCCRGRQGRRARMVGVALGARYG